MVYVWLTIHWTWMASGWTNCSLMGLPWLTEVYRIFSLIPRASHVTASPHPLQYHLLDQGVVTFMLPVEGTHKYHLQYCIVSRHHKRAISEQWEEGLATRLWDLVKLFQIKCSVQISFVWTPCFLYSVYHPVIYHLSEEQSQFGMVIQPQLYGSLPEEGTYS